MTDSAKVQKNWWKKVGDINHPIIVRNARSSERMSCPTCGNQLLIVERTPMKRKSTRHKEGVYVTCLCTPRYRMRVVSGPGG